MSLDDELSDGEDGEAALHASGPVLLPCGLRRQAL
jgi:hypothetical protein